MTLVDIEQFALAARPRSQDGFLERIRAWSEKNGRPLSAKASGDTLELEVMDVIGDFWWGGGVSARSIKAELDRNPNAKQIRVLVNSPGGDSFDGVAIRALLKRHPANVTMEILGEASSAASVIAMAGDRIEMHSGAMIMIHRAWTVAIGNAEDMAGTAEVLGKIDSSIVDIYAARTKQDREQLTSWLSAETWMTADEAIERGFADAMAAEAKSPPAPKANAKSSREVAPPQAEPPQPAPAPRAENDLTDEERAYLEERRSAARRAQPMARAAGHFPTPFGGFRSR